ncbi:hypothetical protein [Streptomyces sp. B1I3]|uniref:hypothetical protein n=1 Tax=Streptomyces sp. B1I3 TaxID=3042264 RepID=UPI002788A784|nr:hypothetical protein [Streptomyces sp. B1I3]MDQ0792648.1 cobalamin biosynthesis Mg chelatase CobN [Streptomyces sp. B1I3]
MTGNAKIAAALVGGYFLGRTKKAKMAIGFGMFLAGKKLNLDPKQLGRMLADSPVLGTLNEQVRKEVLGATKTAATNALTQRAGGLADSLHRRTLALGDPDGADGRDEEQDDEEYDDRDARDDDQEEPAEEKPAPRRRTAAKSSSKSTAKAPAKSAGRSASGAGRSASGGTRKKTSSATRTASSGARKTTSATRKERGGSNG